MLATLLTLPLAALAATPACQVESGPGLTPVFELFTSEGCSSCPPADKWFSTLKGQAVVAQAFHVNYWDYIGWVDRFATPAHTQRQREMARLNHLRGVYTPQLMKNGLDSRDYAPLQAGPAPARAKIVMRRTAHTDQFEAQVWPDRSVSSWSAYWSVTEHGHSSRVKAGENAGETLEHDFVVRQYTPVGTYQGAQTLSFSAIRPMAGHPRQINLVVSDPRTGQPLQAVSLSCS